MNLVEVTQGNSPIILGQPHSGTYVPDEIFSEQESYYYNVTK